ncbi:protein of unknown function (DUF1449) [Rubidibacter lacunae KORDI 51-2]|uniref:Inner membrane protein YqiJ N-terminal domain-containing protein n=1 Tax=Rubidibacter lacunae KORDI 51-2 TaxID=582515 RepID=U5DNA5_9CHRO|nr:OB-fold-containig protein [Rubidibacter lacunae]ERN43136.1 protein of unknown function (DUF1449) [Rubidibacter lacunae KORDI 51-2]
MLFDPGNSLYWLFLTVGIVFFALVILSGVGEEADTGPLDIDIDIDADLDADVDVDDSSGRDVLLGLLGFGKAPLLLLLAVDFSVWGLTGLLLNTIAGNVLGRIPSGLFGLGSIIFLVSFAISLVAGSFIARLFANIFATFSEDTGADRLIGCTGTVSSATIPHGKLGQAIAIDPQGNRVTISAMLPDWATVVPTCGTRVLVIDRQARAYLAIAEDSIDRERWFEQGTRS